MVAAVIGSLQDKYMAIRKIRNKKTGEVREIDDSQLGQYGLAPQPQTTTLSPTPSAQEFPPESIVGTPESPYKMDITKPGFTQPEPQQKYITGRSLKEHTEALRRARAAGDKAAETDINADYNREFQYQQTIKPAAPSEAMEKRERGLTDADRIVSLLEDKYFQGNQGKSIGYGKGGGISKSLELTTAFGEEISPELEDISSYRALRDSARPAFARAMGDVGNLSEPEQQAAIKNIPDIFQTKGQALQYFKDVRQKLGLPERDLDKKAPVTEQVSVPTGLDVTKPEFTKPEEQPGFLQRFLQRGQEGAKRVTTDIGEANWLGKMLFPRASEVQSKQARGEKVGLGERLGVAGETAFNVLPFAGPGGIATRLAVGGAAKGLTTPGADIEERFKQGGINAITGFLGGKALNVVGKLVRPYANQEKVLQKIAETKFQGKPIRDAVRTFIKENPESAAWGKKVLAGIKDEYNPTGLVDKLKIWNKAYTGAGKIGASERAAVYDIASKAAREQIKSLTPALTAARKFIGINERTKRLGGKYLPWLVAPAAGTILMKWLGIRGPGE